MQLKRDTVYALKILLDIAEEHKDANSTRKLSIKELSVHTGVPRQIAERLCHQMADAGILIEHTAEGKKSSYSADERIRRVTLFDVIEAVEGQTDLFAVLSKDSELYNKYGNLLVTTNQEIQSRLESLSMEKVLSSAK